MITVLFGGSRPEGNTAQLTKMALKGHDYEWFDLTQYRLNPVRDVRHDGSVITVYEDDYKKIIDKVLASDTVIFASPVYWYSLSASLKAFIDHWSETLMDPDYRDFKTKMSEKDFRLIIVGGDFPKVKAKPCITQMKYSLEFLGGTLSGYIIGTAEKPGDIKKDSYALDRAQEWQETLSRNE
ncbi:MULTISPECIES: flavodoxin family protein [Staphylococcus]|jgi:multimeric flavodoxin WrbA|uniref:FMN-dependent NADPH-azoreductase n=1 Tax=Staphylococcus nepalensis TaxID=214473 RepID=A0A291JMH6_9STAP|nr:MULTISPECIES: flavodoxin family protein [Staphylococcus]VDG67948.1 multimeric flavodoxin WrbA family protein [Lacrimispora indolis]ATH60949.1 NAD(P)H-dependent oxidoreductase [Staphylococcus nepalensis]ATH65980.1 NAD(P)H-dependent oxidoreductase [Staphylococcus nepalensis]AWI45370.1 NAD(P)H-dependent oxidoreductase [Staphylococcus nepalensis]MBO1206468.1 flavodoxin family protein [Staphylococcus nepalensis]